MPLFCNNIDYLVVNNGLTVVIINIGNNLDQGNIEIELPAFVAEDKSKKIDQLDILFGSFSQSGRILSVIDCYKRLFVIGISDWKIECQLNVERRPTQIICEDDQILVSDGSGDVYHIDLNHKTSKVLMGHLSIVLDMKLTANKRFLATSDRDEKIRISNFPNSYNIHSFCLGHTEFVSSIEFIDNVSLISGSGDGTLKLWKFMDGKLVYDFDCKKSLKQDQDIAVKNILRLNEFTFSISFYSMNSLLIVSVSNDTIKCVKILTFAGSACYKQFTTRNFLIVASDSGKMFTSYDFERDFTENDHPFLESNKAKSLSKLFETSNPNSEEEEVKVLYKQWFNNVESYLKKKEERIKGSALNPTVELN